MLRSLDVVFDKVTGCMLRLETAAPWPTCDQIVTLTDRGMDEGDLMAIYDVLCRGPSDFTAVFQANLVKPVVPSAPPTADSPDRLETSSSWAAVKFACGHTEVKKLLHEAKFYMNSLRPLFGIAVPGFHGVFTGSAGGGVAVACMILDWCGAAPPVSIIERDYKKLMAVTTLHKHGIQHNGLFLDGHFVYAEDGRAFIVGFSEAETHRCPRHFFPLLTVDTLLEAPTACRELHRAETQFGKFGGLFGE